MKPDYQKKKKKLMKNFQADFIAVLWMSDRDSVTKKHFYVRWPEGVINGHVGIVRSFQGFVC